MDDCRESPVLHALLRSPVSCDGDSHRWCPACALTYWRAEHGTTLPPGAADCDQFPPPSARRRLGFKVADPVRLAPISATPLANSAFIWAKRGRLAEFQTARAPWHRIDAVSIISPRREPMSTTQDAAVCMPFLDDRAEKWNDALWLPVSGSSCRTRRVGVRARLWRTSRPSRPDARSPDQAGRKLSREGYTAWLAGCFRCLIGALLSETRNKGPRRCVESSGLGG